ncbi:substrate-binding periplasmic protein [Pseudomonadota bacterium]
MINWLRATIAIVLMAMTPLFQVRAEEVGVVTFGANESPPFWSSNMVKGGMCGAIVLSASREAGITTSIKFEPLPRLIQSDVGNDLGNPAFFMGDQDYSAIIPIAIYQSALFYYTPNHSEPIAFLGLDDLKKYRIGILKGTLLDRSFFRKHGITFAESYTQESLFRKLKLGRIDLVLEIDLVGHHMIDNLFPGEKDAFGYVVLPNSANPITMMLAEETPAVVARKYSDGLKRIIADGSYLKILEGFYGEGQVPEDWFKHLDRYARMYSFGGGE